MGEMGGDKGVSGRWEIRATPSYVGSEHSAADCFDEYPDKRFWDKNENLSALSLKTET